MTINLLPCPCCGGKPMEMQYDGILWVQCEDCALNTAACDASADYVQLWNRRATQPAAGQPVATWVALTAAGQLRKGDKIRFRFGQETLTETVALVLDAGTEREEIVYNRKRNFYFITSKALAGTSSAKHVEVLRTVSAPPAAAPVAAGEPAVTTEVLRREIDDILREVSSAARKVSDAYYDRQQLAPEVEAAQAELESAIRSATQHLVRIVGQAPPAAAHGDEAVRKDAERYRWLRDEFLADDPALIGLEPGDEEDTLNGAIDAAMRAQAGEGGEV